MSKKDEGGMPIPVNTITIVPKKQPHLPILLITNAKNSPIQEKTT